MSQRIVLKKQFRLYDIYRCATTGEESHIRGISTYTVSDDGMSITVHFTKGGAYIYLQQETRRA